LKKAGNHHPIAGFFMQYTGNNSSFSFGKEMKKLKQIFTFELMKKIYIAIGLCLSSVYAQAQKTEPLYEAYFSHPDDMVQDDNGGYHFKAGSLIVSMSDDGYYKLMDAQGVLLEEGDTDEGDNSFSRHGRWIEYYATGKMKATGNYYHNQPYGHWQFFNEKGSLVAESDILAITSEDGNTVYCKAGTEMVYYDDGKTKEERYFKAEPYMTEDKVLVEDPQTEKKVWKKVPVKSFRPKPFGTWVYYNPDGTVEKREDKKD
jgi:antitoxin component YwqK of YwqJK toxin-antitoxin module